ncbi:MAG: YeeE/YedE family protein [Pseudobacteriovorax sp.]|nr:YeeE/YedE family protein [Pseudobacteriovorax sp.]
MHSDWILALIGGSLIGIAATILLAANGRIFGVSGILYTSLTSRAQAGMQAPLIILGLILGGVVSFLISEDLFINTSDRSLPIIGVAGLLVGFGTRLGSGCTSGHGVCGISRFSFRSILATVTFISAGILTVVIFNMIKG